MLAVYIGDMDVPVNAGSILEKETQSDSMPPITPVSVRIGSGPILALTMIGELSQISLVFFRNGNTAAEKHTIANARLYAKFVYAI
jgi:hypothetical protein